jgi:hypothetical protein
MKAGLLCRADHTRLVAGPRGGKQQQEGHEKKFETHVVKRPFLIVDDGSLWR